QLKIEKQTAQLTEYKNQLEENKRQLMEIHQARIQILEKQKHANELQEKNAVLTIKQKSVKEVVRTLEQKETKLTLFKETESAYQAIEEKYKQQRLAYNRNIAGVLAHDLEKDSACPVCGSVHHPDPA